MYSHFSSHTHTHTRYVCDLVLGGQHNLFGSITRSIDINPGNRAEEKRKNGKRKKKQVNLIKKDSVLETTLLISRICTPLVTLSLKRAVLYGE